jgi:ANTAR domain-containing protein
MDAQSMAELTQEFAALAADLHGDGDNAAALHRAVELSAKYVEGCNSASITVVDAGRGSTIAATDDVARLADALQYELGEGPCLQAAWDDGNYLMFDLAGERRWPRYAEALARRTPVRCVLSFQLPSKDSAALNLFGLDPGAFGDDAVATGALFAAHVSSVVALYEAEEQTANLRTALDSSRQIGAAVGILMAHHHITQDAAFELLRTTSQRLQRKLRDIAARVVETGALPPGGSTEPSGE